MGPFLLTQARRHWQGCLVPGGRQRPNRKACIGEQVVEFSSRILEHISLCDFMVIFIPVTNYCREVTGGWGRKIWFDPSSVLEQLA